MRRPSLARSAKLLLASLVAIALVTSACSDDKDDKAGSGGSTDGAVKAAWVYVGPITDGGWTTAHDAGRKYVEAQLGDKVETTYKENVPEGPEATQTVEDLIKDGNKIIFLTSFGFDAAAQALAPKYPDVHFEHATGAVTGPNLATYYGASEDTIYLTGIAAGAASKTGKIGFVAPFAIPEVIRHINAFALGAKVSNPAATVQVVWTGTWFGPDKEKTSAESLIAAGVDVLASGQDSPATGTAAATAEPPLPFVGYDSDQSMNFPGNWLTASLYDWGPYYLQRVQATIDGTWKTGAYYGSLADGFVHLAPYGSSVSADTKAAIEAKLAALKDGSFYELTGPLTDQAGTVRVADGVRMTLPEILSMDWFVQGVIGNPKA